ncbi:uncharacterized protein LOC129753701 [Uranotaenia lowii]|uniref:uncharacterized protein LOC129753701 n=1 Tax=Uranotaenia lowii TaxID=190385 RepID=UPI002479E4EF|nr:uncharacterized protein LOC129753701 [Uranotaenia lowii]
MASVETIKVQKYQHITKEYLGNILSKDLKDESLTVSSFGIVPALAKGQNFSSDILRVRINFVDGTGEEKVKTYIVKTVLENESMAEMLEEYDVFQREICVYKDILPKVQRILISSGCDIKLTPAALAIGDTNPKHFVFEDLTSQNFIAADRKTGLNYQQLQMILRKLALFHATTAYLYSLDPKTMENHHIPNISEDVKYFHAFFRNSVIACAQLAQNWSTTSGSIAKKLMDLEKTVISKCSEVYTADANTFNVLNHADLSINNVMLKFDDKGNTTDCLLVDFALTFFGSPALDLSYLLYTSSSEEVTTDQFDLLIQDYYCHLVDCLKKIGYPKKMPTLLDIQVEMLRKGFVGVLYVTFMLPLRMLEDTAHADMAGLLDETPEAIAFRKQLYQNPKFYSRMEYLLNYFDRKDDQQPISHLIKLKPVVAFWAVQMEDVSEKYRYLTKEYLEGILRREQCESSITVKEFKVVPALAKGENYNSNILRVHINYVTGSNNQRTQTYIVKSSFENEGIEEVLDEFDMAGREIAVYENVLPKVEQLLTSIGYSKKLAPSVHAIGHSNPKHFVFEDLALQGFRSADRRQGLNFNQLEMVLERVAKWHAATAFLYNVDEETMKNHHFRNINEDIHHFYPLFQNSMISCAELAANWSTTSKSIAKKLFDLEKTVIQKGCQVYTRDPTGFNVLTHGDLWVNNVMYKQDSRGNLLDCILVDYAVGFFGSPAIDLSYLLFTSSADEVTTDQFDLLLQKYHSHLIDCLEKLGYSKKLPSLIDIQVEMLRKGFVGIMFATFLIPLRLMEDTASADLGNLLASTSEAVEFRRKLFDQPRYQSRMEYLLNYFDRKGYLD